MDIYESGENYLEAIFKLGKEQDIVRSIDLANFFNFSKPSVSRAIHKLVKLEFLIHESNGNLKFTAKGLERAEMIYERHQFFSEFLVFLGVEEDIAENDACRMEHVLSKESFKAIKKFVLEKKDMNC